MLVDGSQAERGKALNHGKKNGINRPLKIRVRYVLRLASASGFTYCTALLGISPMMFTYLKLLTDVHRCCSHMQVSVLCICYVGAHRGGLTGVTRAGRVSTGIILV